MRTYTDQLKAQVIAEAIVPGASIRALAKKYDIPTSTVQHWLATTDRALPIHENARDELGELVYEYLKAGLLALTAQARQAATPDLISGQGESLYLLHGVIADKVVLVLRGLERGEPDAAVPAEPG